MKMFTLFATVLLAISPVLALPLYNPDQDTSLTPKTWGELKGFGALPWQYNYIQRSQGYYPTEEVQHQRPYMKIMADPGFNNAEGVRLWQRINKKAYENYDHIQVYHD